MMTFAMMWIHNGAVLAAADTAVLYDGARGGSGPTALGQRDDFRGFRVLEGAMKLTTLPAGCIVTGAGDASGIIAFTTQLAMRLALGSTLSQAVSDMIRIAAPSPDTEMLIGVIEDRAPVIYVLRGDAVRRKSGASGHIAGSLPPEIARAFAHLVQSLDPNLPHQWAITSLQVAAHHALSVEPSLLKLGIGGVVAGSFLTKEGLGRQSDTLWVFTDEAIFGAEGELEQWVEVLFVSVEDGNLFVGSSLYGDEFRQTIISSMTNVDPDEVLHAWADQVAPRMYLPETVVFMNLKRSLALVVPHASAGQCPVRVTKDPFGITVRRTSQPYLFRTYTDDPPAGFLMKWHQWWQP